MKNIAVLLAVFLCIILIIGPLYVLKGLVVPGEASKQDVRTHLNTGNTSRIMGKTAQEVALNAAKILYPAVDEASRPPGVILVQSESWQKILAVLPLVKRYQVPIIPVSNNLMPDVIDYIEQIDSKGIQELMGAQVLIVAENSITLQQEIMNRTNRRVESIQYENMQQLLELIIDKEKGEEDSSYGFIIADNDPFSAIAAAAWTVHTEDELLFLDSSDGELYPLSTRMLMRGNLQKVYVLTNLRDKLKNVLKEAKVEVEYINASTPEEFAIRFAQFYDSKTLVGWDAFLNRKDSGHNYFLCSTQMPDLAASAIQLVLRGKLGPVLWTAPKNLTPIVENYLWKMKPDFWVTPAEGPYNHLWVVGDTSIINYGIQGQGDFVNEINPYEMLGERAVSGLDVLAILSIIFSFAAALWTLFHSVYRMKHVFILTKMMWVLSVFLLGPIGLWLYVVSYKDRPWMKMGNNTMWKRPLWNQAVVATLMGLAFGASTMIVVGFLMSWLGLSTVPFSGRYGLFLLGNPMIIQMINVYIIALVGNAFVFMPVMLMRMRNLSYKESVINAFPSVFISMTSVSLGMMTMMWWLHMEYLPMMPEENHVLWWGTMQLATLVGGLIAYIPNWQLVRYGRKMGTG